jgi:DNA modification methylase
MGMERRQLSELHGWDKNPRGIKTEDFKRLKAQIQELGLYKPFLVTTDGLVLGGNMRLRACTELGITDVDVSVVDAPTDELKLKYALSDNDRAGYYEEDQLAELVLSIPDIKLDDYKIDLGKLTSIDDLLAKFVPDVVEDEIPEDVDPVAKLGDIWQLGRHRLMCGDSTKIQDVEKLMDGKKADMVFTDPPYGISFESNKGKSIKNDDLDIDEMLSFNSRWQKVAFDVSGEDCFMLAWQSPRLLHLMEMFGEWSFFRLITMYKSNRISYPHGAWINKTEPCLVFVKGKPKPTGEKYIDDCFVYVHDKESHEDSNVGHPTPKPVKMVVENIVACAKKDDIVLDLFLGSGSTLIACEQTNRICYGMEIDPHYCDVIIARWEKFTGETAVKL